MSLNRRIFQPSINGGRMWWFPPGRLRVWRMVGMSRGPWIQTFSNALATSRKTIPARLFSSKCLLTRPVTLAKCFAILSLGSNPNCPSRSSPTHWLCLRSTDWGHLKQLSNRQVNAHFLRLVGKVTNFLVFVVVSLCNDKAYYVTGLVNINCS
jgi:hypothetical protein